MKPLSEREGKDTGLYVCMCVCVRGKRVVKGACVRVKEKDSDRDL